MIKWLQALFYLVIICFLPLSYWSTNVLEHEIQQLKREIAALKNRPMIQMQQTHTKTKERPHIDPKIPNLLEEDPFRKNILPELLGQDFHPSGVWNEGAVIKPNALLPFTGYIDISNWVSLCSTSVARLKFGIYETLSPNMAIKVEKRPIPGRTTKEYWVHLREGAYWQPLDPSHFPSSITLAEHFLKPHPVTADDFKFYFDAVMNPHNQQMYALAIRSGFNDIEELIVIDPLTFIVRWKEETFNGEQVIKYAADQIVGGLSPLASFLYQYFSDGTKIIDDTDPDSYRTSSVWAQNFEQHWAKNIIPSCGPWMFDGMSDQQIRFKRNPHHFFPDDALTSKRIYTFRNHFDALWQDFKEGNVPVYILQPSKVEELKTFTSSPAYLKQVQEHNALSQLEYLSNKFYYIGWNQKNPLFKSRNVRQALTMAIDRNRLISQNVQQMGIPLTGPFSYNSNAYNHSIIPLPFDPKQAEKLLQEEGWFDHDGDGVIDKMIDGKLTPFRFSLTYIVKNPTTKGICEYVATALKEIGIECTLIGMDLADVSAAFDEKTFDALCMGWVLGTPPENPRQLWHSSFAEMEGSSNITGFKNTKIDQIIEQLTFETNPEIRTELYHQFHQIIHEEQPYTFLYIPKEILLYREWVGNVFIPKDRQDLIPGADIAQPIESIFMIDRDL